MDIFKSLAGMAEISLTGADIAGSLDTLTRNGIPVFSTTPESDVSVRMVIFRRDYKKALTLLQRRGDTLKLCGRTGLYWTIKRLLQRPVLVLGCMILLTMGLYMPSRIYFVRIEGNESVPANQILEAAEGCGIHFGAYRREVRSEQMKNKLLQAMPQLQWAGVNTYGCIAVISVTERADPEPVEQFPEVGSIVAIRDGIILSCTSTAGNLLCRPGQAVRSGEVLISGFTDCGICIQATLAQGEIYAQTERQLQAVVPTEYQKYTRSGNQRQKITLVIGKKRINLWKDSGICDTTCGRMYKEYYITLPGGFQLPFAIAVETYEDYAPHSDTVVYEEWENILSTFARRYLPEQMIAGSILFPHESFHEEDGTYVLEGKYVCTEMIGRVRQEQIGEHNGENN